MMEGDRKRRRLKVVLKCEGYRTKKMAWQGFQEFEYSLKGGLNDCHNPELYKHSLRCDAGKQLLQTKKINKVYIYRKTLTK